MAGWNDLPPELRQPIVELLDEYGDVAGGLDTSSEIYHTLRALTLVDRDLLRLVSPILWTTINLRYCRVCNLEAFPRLAALRVGALVQSIRCIRDEDESSEALHIAYILSDLITATPNVTSLEFLPSFTAVALLLRLPTTLREQIRELSVTGEPLSASEGHATTLLLGLPNLRRVRLQGIEGDEREDGGAVLLSTLRHLPALECLELLDCNASEGCVTSAWQGGISHLQLRSDFPDSRLQVTLQGLSSTLQSVSLDLSAGRVQYHPPGLPGLSLPLLQHLRLDVGRSDMPLLAAFAESPLQTAHFTIRNLGSHAGEREECIHQIELAVEQHKASLRSISVELVVSSRLKKVEAGLIGRFRRRCQGLDVSFRVQRAA